MCKKSPQIHRKSKEIQSEAPTTSYHMPSFHPTRPPTPLPSMWEEVVGASLWISVDFHWILVDFLHVDFHFLSRLVCGSRIRLFGMVSESFCMVLRGETRKHWCIYTYIYILFICLFIYLFSFLFTYLFINQ